MIRKLAHRCTQSQAHAAGAVAVGVTLCLLTLIVTPTWQRIESRSMLRESLQRAESSLAETQSRLAVLRRDLERLAASSQDQTTVASASNVDRRLLDISTAATEFGLVVDAVEPGAMLKGAGPTGGTANDQSIPISVTGRGPYGRTMAFLDRMREIAPDLTLESAQLNGTADNTCAYRFVLNWWRSPRLTLKPVDAAVGGGR